MTDWVAVIRFIEALLAQYVTLNMPRRYFGDEGSRVRQVEPPPEETLMIRGVLVDFLKRGTKGFDGHERAGGVGLKASGELFWERA